MRAPTASSAELEGDRRSEASEAARKIEAGKTSGLPCLDLACSLGRLGPAITLELGGRCGRRPHDRLHFAIAGAGLCRQSKSRFVHWRHGQDEVAMSKLLSVPEAVERYVHDGVGLLSVGGMHLHNNPMSLVREVVRQRPTIRRLLTSPCGALNADLLVGAGLVQEIALSLIGFEHLGLAPCFRRAAESGTIRILECDEAYITHGLYAGAGGLPFIALPAGLETSDVPKVNQESYAMTTNPFTGGQVLVGAPLRPDVAHIHASIADARGNAVLGGAHF